MGGAGAEASSGKAHLDGGLAHAFKGVSTCFSRRTFVNEVSENRCGGQDGVVYMLEGLLMVSKLYIGGKASYQLTTDSGRMPDGIEEGDTCKC